MMRGLFLAAFLVSTMLTYGLYTMKYEVQRLENKLASLRTQFVLERDATQVLRAEWSYLNNPERLEELASQYLDLVPVSVHKSSLIAQLPLKDSRSHPSVLNKKSEGLSSKTSWKIPKGAERYSR